MRTAAYARYSSDQQRATSIVDQIAVARSYADRQGWTFLESQIYADAAISGASLEGRPGIQQLLSAAATTPRPFDVVLIDDTSRLARDTADAIRAVQQLTFCGVRVVFVSQGVDTASDQAETLVAVHGVVDQLYIKELKHKIKRGIKGQLERGFHTGAKTYGYRSVPVYDPSGRRDADGPVLVGKRREVVPAQAAVIQQIFHWYVAGISQPQIVDHLKASATPSPRGTAWTKHHIRRILRNERYLGQQIWGQTTTQRRPGTSQLVARQKPRDQWHVADRPDLRIVDDELFRRAAERRDAQRARFNIPTGHTLARGRSGLYSPRLLAGLTRCGVCGGAVSTVSGGYGSPRYGCGNSWNTGLMACDNRMTILAKVVDPLVLGALRDQLLRPEIVAMVTNAVTAEITQALNQTPVRRDALRARRDEVAKKLAHLIEAVEDGVGLSSLSDAMTQREAELREIDARLATLDRPAPAANLAVIPTWVRQQLDDLAGLLLDGDDTALRTKSELARLNVQFILSPVPNEGTPFLRLVGTGDLDPLCGIHNLPPTARAKARTPPPHPLSVRERSLLLRGS